MTQAEIDQKEAATFDTKGLFVVLRRGRPSAKLRKLTVTLTFTEARLRFFKAAEMMRQGSVILIGPDNQILEYDCAPMVRTRW